MGIWEAPQLFVMNLVVLASLKVEMVSRASKQDVFRGLWAGRYTGTSFFFVKRLGGMCAFV